MHTPRRWLETATINSVRFILTSFGRGCNGGEIISRSAIIGVNNPYSDKDTEYILVLESSTTKRRDYEVLPLKEYEKMMMEMPRVATRCVATTHEGPATWEDHYGSREVTLLVLPDGQCIGTLDAPEEFTLRGWGVA
jgi:hypothetical protein